MNPKLCWILFVILAVGFGLGSFLMTDQERKTILNVWTYQNPYSTDPLKYDAAVHHIAFRGVYSSLVSQYPSSGLQGDLATQWYSTSDKKKWSFLIPEGMTFSDGSPLTAEVIRKSLSRAAYILKLKGSKAGVLEHLIGYESMKGIQNIEGIGVEQNGVSRLVTLTFSKPMPRLLELISFGMYAIVSPEDYDADDGHWINPKAIRASGPLKLLSFDDRTIQLERWRQLGPRQINRYSLRWSSEAKNEADLILASSHTVVDRGREAATGPLSDTSYIHCNSWNRRDSPCHQIETRRWLRTKFYESIESQGLHPPSSFFPPSLITRSPYQSSKNQGQEPKGLFRLNIRLNKSTATTTPVFNKAFKDLLKLSCLHGIFTDPSTEDQLHELDPNLQSYETDLIGRMTGILLESPSDDIRFMFESKEGIRLPDPTGKIHNLLQNESLDIAAIDQQLLDDAIIWPIGHSASSLIFTKDLLDLTQLNLVQPPTDLSRIRFKQ